MSVETTRPKVVIVGGGFGGMAAARGLRNAPVEVVLIDRQNHHLFQPLLYQVATAALSPADIAWPIRRLLRDVANARVLMSEVTGIDHAAHEVLLGEKREHYDYLVLACGAAHSYFGHDDWAAYAPGLKQLSDATSLRRRILLAFEQAEMERDPIARDRLLSFVIVGGGATGVEMAGAISELARKALAKDFRRIDPRRARVRLIEAGGAVLPAFDAKLSGYAKTALEKLGVEVLLGTTVTGCDRNGVEAAGASIPAATVIWAAGVKAAPIAGWLDVAADRAGRVLVTPGLEVETRPNTFVVGDAASLDQRDGGSLPGTAPVAKQQGAYVARVIERRISGRRSPVAFRYRDAGMLATIGRRAAIVDLGWLRLRGRLAWWFWGLVHVYFLINLRSRLAVAMHWMWSYVTFDRGARLIIAEGRVEE